MMKRRNGFVGRFSENSATKMSREEEIEWEMRPGGMLVQKRSEKVDLSALNLRIRVAFGAVRHEISVNSQATFGELKKLIAAETGLQPGEQRLIFREKERENGEFLDMSGVKNRSKIILLEDPSTIEKRAIEMRRNVKIQSVYRAIFDVSMEVDLLVEQVSAIAKSISSGSKVAEVRIATLIEMLMRQAIKLENISAEGDAAAQKNLQGKRVQKCVETLDVLKISNARAEPVVVTTKWETFDPPTTAHWEFFD